MLDFRPNLFSQITLLYFPFTRGMQKKESIEIQISFRKIHFEFFSFLSKDSSNANWTSSVDFELQVDIGFALLIIW